MKRVQKGDIGVRILATIRNPDDELMNLSDPALEVDFVIKKPSGELMTVDTTKVINGVEGQVVYVTAAATDLDEAGLYSIQGIITDGGAGELKTRKGQFEVLSNL